MDGDFLNEDNFSQDFTLLSTYHILENVLLGAALDEDVLALLPEHGLALGLVDVLALLLPHGVALLTLVDAAALVSHVTALVHLLPALP